MRQMPLHHKATAAWYNEFRLIHLGEKMLRSLASVCLLIVVAAAPRTAAMAQSWMGGSGMSAFGGGFGSGSGASGFGNAGFGASRFGGGGFGSSGFGGSPFGGGGFGGGGFGAGGFGGGFGSGGFGSGGSAVFGNRASGMGGFGGGPAFIGRDSAVMAATLNEMGRAGTQFFNQMNRNIARPSRDRQPAADVESVPQPMRVALRVAFDAPRPTAASVTSRVRARLGKILADHGVGQPDLTMEGDTAVLRGLAASDSQRLVLEKLVSLEPGVRQVRNEMVVIEPPAAATAPAD
jgi:hypothetical protein